MRASPTEEPFKNNKILCPWHSCIECDRTSANSGGKQFRCLTCPISYCFDCYPTTMEMVEITPPNTFKRNFKLHGFEMSENTIYYRCEECLEEFNKTKKKTKSKATKQSIKEKRELYLKPLLPEGDLSVGLKYLYSGTPGGGKFSKADSFEIQRQEEG